MTEGLTPPVRWLELDERAVIVGEHGVATLLGRAPDALIGTGFAELLSFGERLFLQTHVLPTVALHGRIEEVYVDLRHADGTTIMTVATFERRATPAGARVVVALMPMRRRRLYEQELLATRDAAAQAAGQVHEALTREQDVRTRLAVAERLASLGQASAGVAHELNNPLAYVAGNVELLAGAVAERAGVDGDIVRDLREGVGRIRDIIDGLRKLSRMEASPRAPVELAAVIRATLQVAGATVRARARVDVEVGTPPPWALADEGQLGQIVLNLVMNAAQALPVEGAIANRIGIAARQVDDVVELTVSDNGPGVPAALQARIFQPFFTTKPPGDGTGLGLSVCRDLATALGGTIELVTPSTAASTGAMFRVRLPACSAPAPTSLPASPLAVVAAPPAVRPPRVLVIEDEAAVARVLRRALSDSEVTWMANGAEAWAAFERGQLAAYDVVLCDLLLPIVTGMELYRRVRAASPATASRMVFVTGGAQSADALRFLASVDNRRLAKPFDLQAVRHVVRDAVGR